MMDMDVLASYMPKILARKATFEDNIEMKCHGRI